MAPLVPLSHFNAEIPGDPLSLVHFSPMSLPADIPGQRAAADHSHYLMFTNTTAACATLFAPSTAPSPTYYQPRLAELFRSAENVGRRQASVCFLIYIGSSTQSRDL